MDYTREYKKENVRKILIVALVIAYAISPDLIPGPIDDILILLLGCGQLPRKTH